MKSTHVFIIGCIVGMIVLIILSIVFGGTKKSSSYALTDESRAIIHESVMNERERMRLDLEKEYQESQNESESDQEVLIHEDEMNAQDQE